jgi:NAD(P)-dependent dehydrogenase (short-subunit alcohol dehydrogenase family)
MPYAPLDLTSKTAVVVGGTSGIGLAIAKGLAQAGANVVPTGRRAELAQSAAADIKAAGGKSFAAPCDVSNRASIDALLAATIAEFGSVEILVNSAGTTKRTPSLDVTEAEWNNIIEVNLSGTFRACQVFGRHMIDRKYGRIINIASVASHLALFEVAAYCASKGAVGMLTKALAVEWGKHGVCVNAIAPGVYRTDLNAGLLDGTARGAEFKLRNPMGRFGQLNELIGAAIFLASESASYTNGHILAVDGGMLASGVNQ